MRTFTLPGGLAGPPSVCSSASNRLDVFATGPGNTVWRWSLTSNGWQPPSPLLAGPTSIPAVGVSAVASGPGRVEVFAADRNTRAPAWWRGNGAQWTPAVTLPAGPNLPAEAVTAVASSPDNIDVFGAGAGNTPWWWHWDGTRWSPPIPLGGLANLPAERIAAVSPAPGRLDVFAAGAGNHLWHWRKNPNATWGPPEDLGGNLAAAGVSAVSWGPNRVDVFAATADPGFPVQHWWSAGGAFGSDRLPAPPRDLRDNGVAAGTVAAVSFARDRLDVFGGTGDQRIAHWQWDGRAWSGPNHHGSHVPAEELTAAVRVWPNLQPNLQPRRRIDVFTRGTGNTLLQWPGGGIENATTRTWSNWVTNRVKNGATVARPDSLEELVNVITGAEQRGQGARAVGTSWSNSDVAVSPGVVIETDALDGVLTEVTSDCLSPAAAGRRLVHVEGGIKLWQLNALLDDRRLALHTQGGSAGQSVAGVLSTSAHGMDVDRGPIPDMVRAIHLVGPGGVQHWIEPADGPITDPVALGTVLDLPPENIHYDNDWFNSALVAVGSFGVVYSLIVEVDPLYDLRNRCDATDWETAKTGLKGGAGNPFPGNRGVQVVVEPYGAASRVAYLTTRTEVTPPTVLGGGGLPTWLMTLVTAQVALQMRGTPALIPITVSQLTHFAQLGDPLATTKTDQAWAHSIMGGPDPGPAQGLTVEAVFDATPPKSSYLDFVDATLQVLTDAYAEHPPKGYLGWISLRFQGGSRAYLSPMHAADLATHRSVTVEYAALWKVNDLGQHVEWGETPDLISRLEGKVREFGGAFHWGLNDYMDVADVVRSYPRLDTWRRVRWQLTRGGTVRTFDSDFTRRCGLSDPPLPSLAVDYDRDGLADFAVWRPADASWWFIDSSTGANREVQFGKHSDIPVPGDYDGDGTAEMAVFDPYTGTWRTPQGKAVKWGVVGDVPVPGDYLGAGATQYAVWRPTDGTWRVLDKPGGKGRKPVRLGDIGDIPVPGDYDGDGKTDFAVWHPADGTWSVIDSSTGTKRAGPSLGQPGDVPVPADYDGDGKTDFAVWRPADGTWRIIESGTGKQRVAVQWGQPGDIPVPGNYNSQKRADFTVWRPSDGVWYVLDATTLTSRTQQWGQAGDIPV